MPFPSIASSLPHRGVPVDKPTKAEHEASLKPFSDAVLSNLLSAHKVTSLQDGHAFTDEASFLSYMASTESDAMASLTTMDLTQPLSSYYISSSHNTYLSGHQLYGEASVDAYTSVLTRGCRCLEIDVWDGDSDSDTSSSDAEGAGLERRGSEAKRSRWTRVKARAARMRSRSRSGSLAHTMSPESKPAPATAEASSVDRKYLAPHATPSLPVKCEPRVLHGHTLTQSVTFRSVCEAIRESAFTSSPLPVIVSLEVHASLAQQEIMVDIMRETWDGFLVDIGAESDISILPSPDALRGKILIKVKWTPNSQTGESNNPIDHVVSNSTDGVTEESLSTSAEKSKKASKVLGALSELGIYTRAYTFKQFSQPEAAIPTHVFSLSESKVQSMHADPLHGPALFDHNRSFLMRVFPKSTRINSSNVDPAFHWRQGAQMVALNWQKMDRGMMLNAGMFAGTDGWVLKPEGYRHKAADRSNRDVRRQDSPVARKQFLDLEIRLLAGQRIPVARDKDGAHASKMKPYVKMQLHIDTHGPPGYGKNGDASGNAPVGADSHGGEEADDQAYKRRSATCRTDCPDYAGEHFSWAEVPDVIDELSFLRLKVMDDRSLGKDTLVAWACIRLDRLQTGHRFIHLFDSLGLPSGGALLVHISKRLTPMGGR